MDELSLPLAPNSLISTFFYGPYKRSLAKYVRLIDISFIFDEHICDIISTLKLICMYIDVLESLTLSVT